MESNLLTIELVPRVEFDEESGMYSASFDQFPMASAAGYTSGEAAHHLFELLPVLFEDHQEEIMQILFSKYLTKAQNNLLKADVETHDSRGLLRLAAV